MNVPRKLSRSEAALISEAHGNASPGPATEGPGGTPKPPGPLQPFLERAVLDSMVPKGYIEIRDEDDNLIIRQRLGA